MFKECIHTSKIYSLKKHVILFYFFVIFRYIYPCTLQVVRTPAALSLPAPSNSIHFVFFISELINKLKIALNLLFLSYW